MQAYPENKKLFPFSRTFMPGAQKMRIIFFATAIIFFFFNFCNIDIFCNLAQAPQSEITQESLSGFNFITGTTLSSPAIDKEKILLKKITANVWAILALAAGASGEFISLGKGKRQAEYAMAVALSGIISLLILSFSVNKYEHDTAAGLFIIYTAISFQFGYWAALAAFILAMLVSYFQVNKKRNSPREARRLSPPIHINIITQHNGEA